MSALITVRRAGLTAMAAALLLAGPAAAQPPAQGQTPPAASAPADAHQIRQELERLRREFEEIRDSYGARLAALEARLTGAGAQQVPGVPSLPGQPSPGAAAGVPSQQPPPQLPEPQPAPPAMPPQPPGGTEEAPPPPGTVEPGTGALPVYGAAGPVSKVFNPDIAVIGNFLGTGGRNSIEASPAFELGEAEASFQAVVDPYARADFFFAFSPEGVEIEEGFLTFPTLPGGLLAKVGRMKQPVGKANTLHAHVLPWADRPLVLRNLLGEEEGLADSGVSVSRLLLNPWFFLEATGEVYQGNSGVFQSHERSQVSWLGRLRGYRDLTEGTNIDLGASFARGHNDAGPDFTTRLFAVDATFRYRPLQRAIYRRLLTRTELFWSRRAQEDGTAAAFGLYASGEYQFARRWIAGARYDWSERARDASLVDRGASVLLTYRPSEFSQIRGQYRRSRYAEGVTAHEALVQFLFSIGAHGAHVF